VKGPAASRDEPPRRTAAAAGDRPAAADNDRPRFVIGALLSIEGDLESKGDVLVDGRVRGNITCNRLIVGADASIEGDILADEVVIRGKVAGPIRAGSVSIEATGRVEGYIYHATLSVEAGAVFQGVSRCRKDPKSLDATTERQVSELNAKAAEMMAVTRSELSSEVPESMAMLPGLSPAPPEPMKHKSNGRKAALP
jgi:cytoskeletal protein CcmA (bactofilin family)